MRADSLRMHLAASQESLSALSKKSLSRFDCVLLLLNVLVNPTKPNALSNILLNAST